VTLLAHRGRTIRTKELIDAMRAEAAYGQAVHENSARGDMQTGRTTDGPSATAATTVKVTISGGRQDSTHPGRWRGRRGSSGGILGIEGGQ
jgi:hypothetical protein